METRANENSFKSQFCVQLIHRAVLPYKLTSKKQRQNSKIMFSNLAYRPTALSWDFGPVFLQD